MAFLPSVASHIQRIIYIGKNKYDSDLVVLDGWKNLKTTRRLAKPLPACARLEAQPALAN